MDQDRPSVYTLSWCTKPVDSFVSRAESSYLVLLEGILNSSKIIQDAANLSGPPQTLQAASETREAVFCRIDGNAMQSIKTLSTSATVNDRKHDDLSI